MKLIGINNSGTGRFHDSLQIFFYIESFFFIDVYSISEELHSIVYRETILFFVIITLMI